MELTFVTQRLRCLQCYKMEDASLRLQSLLSILRESIMHTITICERPQIERVPKHEILQALRDLQTNTVNVANEIRLYIENDNEINQDLVREGTELTLDAQDKIASLNSLLQHHESS